MRQPDRAQLKGIPLASGSRPMSKTILQGEDAEVVVVGRVAVVVVGFGGDCR